MRRRAAVLLPSAFFALVLSALWSCGSDSGSPTKPGPDSDPDPDPPPLSHAWTPGVVGLPPADSAVLDSAGARYRTLRMAGTAESARASLVAALTSGWDGVAAAGVTVDGTTIQINFMDGVKAILVTDEIFHTTGGAAAAGLSRMSSAPTGLRPSTAGSTECGSSAGPQTDVGCADMVVPSSSRVSVVNPAGATNPNASAVSQQFKEAFSSLGWNDDDIEIRQSTGRRDRDFTPEDIFHQEEAGVVVLVAQGATASFGTSAPSSGENVGLAVQAFNGGAYPEYEGEVTPERWADYEQWQKEGKIIHGQVWVPSTQTMVDQAYIREDLLAEELQMGEGTLIHLVVPQSAGADNLEGLTNAASGPMAATGWDDFVVPDQAANSVITLTGQMVGSGNTGASSFPDAFDALEGQGGTVLQGSGTASTMVSASQPGPPLYLAAQIDFDAPFSCLKEGTVFYDVDVSYPLCPGWNQSFDFFPGGEFSLDGLPAYGAEISYQAKDADGTVLGAGIYDLSLGGGPNDVDLCPCQGTVAVDFSDISSVPGVDAGAQLFVRVDYADADIPAISSTKDVSALATLGGWEAIPGKASFAHTLIDGAGKVLAYAPAEEFDLRCDDTATSGLCFGWLELTADQIPSGTSSMVVSGTSDHSWIEPSQVTLMPGGQADLGGLLVGDIVHVTAEARSGSGEVLDVIEFDQVLACGPNEVTLNFPTYGLVLFTEFTPAPASGIYGPLISGLVRKWEEGDTLIPTGDPLPGVEVHLSTDRGGFRIGLNPAVPQVTETTNEWGWVSTYLVSSSLGTATVSASADELELEAEPVTVEFKTPVKVMIDESGERYDSISYADTARYIHQYCVIYQKWNNGRLISEDSYPGRGPGGWGYTGHHIVGDTVRFVWKPGTGCTADPDYSVPFISGAYLHYFYGEDYDHQVTVKMIEQKNPLTQTAEYTTTLTDPWGPPPSPFDLSASEQYVLSGFRELWE